MTINSNYKMAFEEMTGEELAKRIGYSLRDLQKQVLRWGFGSIEKESPVDAETVKAITQKVSTLKREDSKEKARKANQLHFLMFGETATEVIPQESKKPIIEDVNTPTPAEEKPKAKSQLKEVERAFKRTDFGFIEAFIEWLSSAAPLAIVIFAFASFVATGIFNAVFYGYYVGAFMGVILAVVQDGARFALFLASAKMFKNGKSVLGIISALVSLALVGFEIWESAAVAKAWNPTQVEQLSITFSFIVLLGFFLELVMALIIHPFKRQ